MGSQPSVLNPAWYGLSFALGAVAGCIVAVIWQPALVQSFGAGDEGFEGGVATVRAMFVVLANGFVIETGSESLDSLLSRGGSASMLNTVWLVIWAMRFGGVMVHTGLAPNDDIGRIKEDVFQ